MEREETRLSRLYRKCYFVICYVLPLLLVVFLFSLIIRILTSLNVDLVAIFFSKENVQVTWIYGDTTCTVKDRFTTNFICSVLIWAIVVILSIVLLHQMRDVISTEKKKMGWIVKGALIFLIVSVNLYEVWMFTFIHDVYTPELPDGFQVFLILPCVALFFYTFYQCRYLIYNKPSGILPKATGAKFHMCNGVVFNGIMILHAICMALIFTYGKPVPRLIVPVEGFGCWVLAFIGIIELILRFWIIYEYVRLLVNFREITSVLPTEGSKDLSGEIIVAPQKYSDGICEEKEKKKESYTVFPTQDRSFTPNKTDIV